MLTKLFLALNKLFSEKDHPFNNSANWVLDLNYSDFEYDHTKWLLKMYSKFIDLDELKGKKILDIWCWWWWKAIYIAEKYDSFVTGIDLNDTFLKEAEKKALSVWVLEKVNFHYMDALNTTFKDNEFDFIIMSDVIEHIPSTGTLFDECNRVLKKGWVILFDFAPYYHYFGHHLWDTLRIPWLHLITTESFRIKLYERSVNNFPDANKRIDLRIWLDENKKRVFSYLNKISRKDFENIINNINKNKLFSNVKIDYFMLKDLSFLSKVPLLREIWIKHIVWIMKK